MKTFQEFLSEGLVPHTNMDSWEKHAKDEGLHVLKSHDGYNAKAIHPDTKEERGRYAVTAGSNSSGRGFIKIGK